MRTPARGYSRPPFQLGQQAALKHGTRVADRAEQVADQVEAIAAQVADQHPHTAPYLGVKRSRVQIPAARPRFRSSGACGRFRTGS